MHSEVVMDLHRKVFTSKFRLPVAQYTETEKNKDIMTCL